MEGGVGETIAVTAFREVIRRFSSEFCTFPQVFKSLQCSKGLTGMVDSVSTIADTGGVDPLPDALDGLVLHPTKVKGRGQCTMFTQDGFGESVEPMVQFYHRTFIVSLGYVQVT